MSIMEMAAAETEQGSLIIAAVAEGEAPRVEYACERCGGIAVTRDAWAEWDVSAQAWVLSETFDFAFCHQCHRETRLVVRPVTEKQG
jgi:Zn finger protein HypA/HybF involved in hydrogenase expression